MWRYIQGEANQALNELDVPLKTTVQSDGGNGATLDDPLQEALRQGWDPAPPNLHEPRLERQLHVSGFRIPPGSVGFPKISAKRQEHRLCEPVRAPT